MKANRSALMLSVTNYEVSNQIVSNNGMFQAVLKMKNL